MTTLFLALGLSGVAATIAFWVGFTFGLRFVGAREATTAKEPLLTPQLITDERIKVVLDSQSARAPGPAEAPRPYRMPGLEDG